MSKRIAAFIVALLTTSITSAQTPTPPPEPPALTHVIIISIDGARPDAIPLTYTPTLDVLVERGASAAEANTTALSVTLPAHTSMLTGQSIDQHGVNWNVDLPLSLSSDDSPTVITLAQQAGYKTGMAAGKSKIDQLHQLDETAYAFAREGDRSVVDAAIEMLDDGVEVLFVHLPNVDYFGHRNGWMSEVYMFEFTNTDAQIGRLMFYLIERDLIDTTLVIVTADHGGTGTVHGADIPEHTRIPWIIAGPGVEPGSVIETPVWVGDTAATAACVLGIALPDESTGKVITEAFADESFVDC